MTIELTPEQLHDLRESVKAQQEKASNTSRALWDGPPHTQKTLLAESMRLESLYGLLTNSTAVLLYRP